MTPSTRPSLAQGRLERWTLDNGLTVLYRQDASFPLASATLLLGAGSRWELRAQAGLCSMTVDLLMQGTRRRNARELARTMESVGASMGTQVHEDYSEMGFMVPAAEISRAFGVMAEVLTQPSFPHEEIVKEKAHVLAGLLSRKDAIFNVAYDALNRKMFGNEPYGRLIEGSLETVKQFKRSDFRQWHEHHIQPHGAILSLSGPMEEKVAIRLIEKNLGRWKGPLLPSREEVGLRDGVDGKDPPSPGLRPTFSFPPLRPGGPADASVAGKGEVVKSNRINIHAHFEQAYLMVGFPAASVRHPDHILMKVLNTLLGGGMSSRLFVTLRETLGLAYEVSSFYPTRLGASHWVIYLGLPKEKLEAASEELDRLLQTLADKGPTAVEVLQAKAMIRGAFLMDRQTHRRQAWYAAWWDYLGRGPAYAEEFLHAVDAVTPRQLHALLRRMLQQPRVTVTVAPK